MSKILLLTETLLPHQANLVEMTSAKSKDCYLRGIFMQADVRNGNKRIYPLSEITRAVNDARRVIAEGSPIMGELNHPDTAAIDLTKVSHIITELNMVGSNACGTMKLLNTPCGNIARALYEGGARPGVSSRGSGSLNESGEVSGYIMNTIDIVALPSAPGAYPTAMMESLYGSNKVMSLAEAMCHDAAAQKYLSTEIKKFLDSLKM